MTDLDKAWTLLEKLTTPSDTAFQNEKSPGEWFENLLTKKLKDLHEFDESQDVRWTYVELCLKTLKTIGTLTKNLEPPIFSVKSSKAIESILQTIVGIGIVPNLIPGVGMPIENRSKFVEVFVETKRVRVDQKRKRIASAVSKILEILEYGEEFSVLVVSKNFGDVLAALIQLSFAPFKKPDPNNKVDEKNSDIFVMTSEMYEILSLEKEMFRSKLKTFINRAYQPLVVKQLLIIQSEKNSPNWLKKSVGVLLSERLLLPEGVMSVVRGVLDIGLYSSSSNESEDKKLKVISGVLSRPPSSYFDAREYYKIICPQILQLLSNQDPVIRAVGSMAILSISERSTISCKTFLLDPLFRPLMTLSDPNQSTPLISELDLEASLLKIHSVFVIDNDPSAIFLSHLKPIIGILLSIHTAISFGISRIRATVKELILRYLKHGNEGLETIKYFAFGENDFLTFSHNSLKFIPGETGATSVIRQLDDSNFYVQDDEKSIAVIDLIGETSPEMSLDFFMNCVEELTLLMSNSNDISGDINSSNCLSKEGVLTNEAKLLQIEKDIDKAMKNLRKNLMVIRCLGLLSEDDNLQENLSKNSSRMIELISLTIQRGAALINSSESESPGVLETQSLLTSLSILSIYLTSPDVKITDWKLCSNFLSHLKTLQKSHEDTQVRSTSGKLYELISTHGYALEHAAKLKKTSRNICEKTERIKQVIKETENLQKSPESQYNKALLDLSDPLVPVRGHGIISLGSLLEKKDSEALSNLDFLYSTLCEHLEDEDSYVYLSAIKSLVILAGAHKKPERILEALLEELRRPRTKDVVETQTKIGEALVKITSLMGETTPKYKNILLNGILSRVDHSEELVRASALSTLGQVCGNLNYSLGPDVQEIFAILENVLQFDSSVIVRRSSVVVVLLLLEGLGSNAFSILKDKLKSIYKTLKNSQRRETDEVLIHHAQKSIDILDNMVKNFLCPPQSLQKTIYVLDAPPDPL